MEFCWVAVLVPLLEISWECMLKGNALLASLFWGLRLDVVASGFDLKPDAALITGFGLKPAALDLKQTSNISFDLKGVCLQLGFAGNFKIVILD